MWKELIELIGWEAVLKIMAKYPGLRFPRVPVRIPRPVMVMIVQDMARTMKYRDIAITLNIGIATVKRYMKPQ